MSKVNKISLSSKLKQNLRESTLWVTGAIGLILFLALSTYDIDDPGVSYVGNESQIQNAIGKLGALLADFLFNLFVRRLGEHFDRFFFHCCSHFDSVLEFV